MDLVDESRIGERVRRVGVREDDEERDRGRDEQQTRRGHQVRPGAAICSRQGFDVEPSDPAHELAAAPVDGPMAACDEAVQIALHRLVGPVALRARKVRRRPPVQRGHRQHLRRRQGVQPTSAGAREKVLEAVPVLPPKPDELLRTHR